MHEDVYNAHPSPVQLPPSLPPNIDTTYNRQRALRSSIPNPNSSLSTMPTLMRSENEREVSLASHAKLPVAGSRFTSSSLGRSYITPDSSVSPRLSAKNLADSRDASPDSGDETDGLDMEGIDDNGHARNGQGDLNSSPCLDPVGARTEEDSAVAPDVLADTYLPALFAQHGPCAIRHLTQYLSINNPKFGSLAPGKQRRLVVKALELRKGSLFEKVGWGRWNAIDGKMTDAGIYTPESMPQTFDRGSSSIGTSLKQSGSIPSGLHRPPLLGSYPAMSSYSSNHEFMFSPSLSVAGTVREDEEDGDIDPLELDMEDGDSETDEEDWRSLGAEALRARQAAGSHTSSYREGNGFSIGSYTGSQQRSSPYPIRRRSSAGVYQINSPHASGIMYSKSPSFSRTTSFPKTSSYLKASPMSNARASSFSRAREANREHPSPYRGPTEVRPQREDRGAQAEAVEALVMLSGSLDDR